MPQTRAFLNSNTMKKYRFDYTIDSSISRSVIIEANGEQTTENTTEVNAIWILIMLLDYGTKVALIAEKQTL